VSDFGFDAYGLDDAEPTGHPHPLEIASDLIAAGKPHAALEMLTVHHEQLADDPEYLLLCAEAWRADGDTLRAQQALLGAARLAPEDPRPLEWLGELLAERGEHDKAERVLEKARALLAVATQVEEPLDEMGPEAEDDLIAFAERQERRGQAALTPRQIVLGTVERESPQSGFAATGVCSHVAAGVCPDRGGCVAAGPCPDGGGGVATGLGLYAGGDAGTGAPCTGGASAAGDSP